MHIRLANNTINLPLTAATPARTRAALERAADLKRQISEASREWTTAEAALRAAEAEAPRRRARAWTAGTELEEGDPVALARIAVEEGHSKYLGLLAAEGLVMQELRAAVWADAETWSASLAAAGDKALLKLTTAARMADEARADLDYSIGLLNMFRLHEEQGTERYSPLHVKGSHIFPLGGAIDGLHESTAAASAELAQVRPATRRSGKAKTSEGIDL